MEYMEYLHTVKAAVQAAGYGEKTIVQGCSPWGAFTTALNVLIRMAADMKYETILFQVWISIHMHICIDSEISVFNNTAHINVFISHRQSLEVVLSAADVATLAHYMDADTLVVGPVLEGHEFLENSLPLPLRGRTCPWNTAALWNLSRLQCIGFPMIGDGFVSSSDAAISLGGGVEVRNI
jgi:hypothetical protein